VREAPEAVTRVVREYDRDAGLEWHRDRWYLTYRGERLFTLEHGDGAPMLSLDGYSSAVLEQVKRADTRHARPDMRRGLELALRRRRQAEAARTLGLCEAGRRESDAVADTFRRGGPKPFVHLQSQERRAESRKLKAESGNSGERRVEKTEAKGRRSDEIDSSAGDGADGDQ